MFDIDLNTQEKTMCFTGPRAEKLYGLPKTTGPQFVKDFNALYSGIEQELATHIFDAIENGCTRFMIGCATGTDLIAGRVVAQIMQQNPDLNIHLAMAYPWQGYKHKEPFWNQLLGELRDYTHGDIVYVKDINREIAKKKGKEALEAFRKKKFGWHLNARNEYMLESSEYVCALWPDNTTVKNGDHGRVQVTWQEYAKVSWQTYSGSGTGNCIRSAMRMGKNLDVIEWKMNGEEVQKEQDSASTKKRNKACAIVGATPATAPWTDTPEAWENIAQNLEHIFAKLSDSGYTTFSTGGASGIGQVASEVLEKIKTQKRPIKTQIYIPFPAFGEKLGDGRFGKYNFDNLCRCADEVRTLTGISSDSKRAMHDRYIAMIDDSDTTIAVWDGQEMWTEDDDQIKDKQTASFIRYAEDKQKEILLIDPFYPLEFVCLRGGQGGVAKLIQLDSAGDYKIKRANAGYEANRLKRTVSVNGRYTVAERPVEVSIPVVEEPKRSGYIPYRGTFY